jgi:putative ABC transport system permease protein
VAAVAPELSTQKLVVAGDSNTTTTIVGTSAAYASVHNDSIWQGSFLTGPSDGLALRVAVLGATTASDLGLGANAVGTDLSIGGIPFRIIGVLQSKGGTGPLNQDDMILVPLSTVKSHFVSGDSVRSIAVSVASAGQMDRVKAEITTILKARHGLGAADAADFNVFDQAQLLTTVNSITGLLTVLLAGIASISLIVGGIGIMNIMLVSVRERTREIGIRKAIGAKSRDILLQFLIEALVLSVLGGFIGILVGLGATAVIGAIAGWGFVFSPLTLVVALAFSLAVGVIFGVWPARQAARLDPIAALRYE